ncbi:MAG: glycosyltransferase [Egibacteraceae bacterium]
MLLLVSPLDGTGPGRVMATLAQELPSLGITPLLVTTHGPHHSSLTEAVRTAGVAVEHLDMQRMWDPTGPARLAGLVRGWRPQVVHTRTTRADLVGRVATAMGVAVVNNPVNLYPDDCLTQHGPVVGRAVMALARAGRRATRLFVANAQAVAANVQTAFRVPAERIQVIYDGIRLEPWAGAHPADLGGVSPTDLVCLTVARLHPQKGLEDLVDAAAEVVGRRPDVRFVVAGDGPARHDLNQRIRAAGLQDQVLLLGNRDDVPSLAARACLFVLPSRFEGLPSAIIEAMGAGLPVVATAVGGVPELVDHGVTGWLVPAASPPALAKAILEALACDLKATATAGRRRALEHFSASAMARAFAQVYEEVASR